MRDQNKIQIALFQIFVAFLLILCKPQGALAFGPAAHVAIVQEVMHDLPPSIIKKALEDYPGIAYAGANGPDIGYLNGRGLLDIIGLAYAPWGDRFHYHLAGSFALTQLRDALASGDEKSIAWAAGWITHTQGDLWGHGNYVNQIAGVTLDNPGGMQKHHELESLAEPYVWYNIAGNQRGTHSYGAFPKLLCKDEDLPAAFVDKICNQVYGGSPGPDHYRNWYARLLFGLRNALGYQYSDLSGSEKRIVTIYNLKTALEEAVKGAVISSKSLLIAAEKDDYTGFSDEWNLDAAIDGRPVGELTVKVKTSNDPTAGTNADVYFGLKLANGRLKEWLLEKNGHNDLERGDFEEYYCFWGDMDFSLEDIQYVTLRMGKMYFGSNDWKCDQINVWINGQLRIFTVNQWFIHKGDSWQTEYARYN